MKNLLFLLALSFLTFSCGSPTIDENGRDENGDFPKSETVYEQPTNPGYTETEYTTDPGSYNRRPILKADPAKRKATETKKEAPTQEPTVVEEVDSQPLVLYCDLDNKSRLRKRKCTDVFLSKFVYDNLKTPEKLDTSGTVLVRFVVKEDGSIVNPVVIQSLSAGLDASALAVVNKLKDDNVKWKPALVNGEPVPSYFVLPIEFKI
jgi:TonB family protein